MLADSSLLTSRLHAWASALRYTVVQSTEEILAILQDAQCTPSSLANGADQDAYIDDALQDEAVYESSYDEQWADHAAPR